MTLLAFLSFTEEGIVVDDEEDLVVCSVETLLDVLLADSV